MFSPVIAIWVMVVAVLAFTAIATFYDLHERRIPNRLTLPMFFAGWIYQLVFNGGSGLLDGLGGFAIGFGILFVLWIVGGGGGGDVKLMGALSVWLGYRQTLLVMIASTVIVILITMFAVLKKVLNKGVRKTRETFTAKAGETSVQRAQRRILPFAVPVMLATWVVLAWKVPDKLNAAQIDAAKTPPVESVKSDSPSAGTVTAPADMTSDSAPSSKPAEAVTEPVSEAPAASGETPSAAPAGEAPQ